MPKQIYPYITHKYCKILRMKNKLNYLNSLIIILSVGLYSCSTNKKMIDDKKNEKVSLNWKVKDTIKYKTIMEQIGDAEFDVNFGKIFGNVFDSISKKVIDSTNSNKDSITNLNNPFNGDFFKKLRSELSNIELTTYLTKSSNFKNVIDIEMVKKSLKEIDSTHNKDIFSLGNSGTQLKGSIYVDGSLHSFWLNNTQKNVISLFYELPTKEVKKGDVWSLKYLNYIQYGNVFYCDNAERKNEVKLVDLIKRNGETIALIEYDIYESVDGNIDFFGNKSPSSMKIKYNARGEFSVDSGKWISYKGLLSIETKGVMSSKSKQKFELIEN